MKQPSDFVKSLPFPLTEHTIRPFSPSARRHLPPSLLPLYLHQPHRTLGSPATSTSPHPFSAGGPILFPTASPRTFLSTLNLLLNLPFRTTTASSTPRPTALYLLLHLFRPTPSRQSDVVILACLCRKKLGGRMSKTRSGIHIDFEDARLRKKGRSSEQE